MVYLCIDFSDVFLLVLTVYLFACTSDTIAFDDLEKASGMKRFYYQNFSESFLHVFNHLLLS